MRKEQSSHCTFVLNNASRFLFLEKDVAFADLKRSFQTRDLSNGLAGATL